MLNFFNNLNKIPFYLIQNEVELLKFLSTFMMISAFLMFGAMLIFDFCAAYGRYSYTSKVKTKKLYVFNNISFQLMLKLLGYCKNYHLFLFHATHFG